MIKLFVIGIGYKPLDKRAKEIIAASDVILASNRLFEVFKDYGEFEAGEEKVRVINNVDETINFIKTSIENHQSKVIILLASGDPMFFGIGRRAVEEFGKERVEILPDVSSIQVAFARIKEPWDNAKLISLHGGPDPSKRRKLEYAIGDIPRLLEKHNRVAVLTDRTYNPSAIAKELAESSSFIPHPSPLRIFVCEKLGYPDEKITEGTPEEISGMTFSDPNVVIILRRQKAKGTGQEEFPKASRPTSLARLNTFGLRETEIAHSRGLITKDEIRAVTIHKLSLPRKGVFWDIGAGSGSVSIEVARLCPELKIFAVEKDEEQLENIRANVGKFATGNIKIISGEAPAALHGLPFPDRVFIGGSGGRLDEIMDLVGRNMPAGIMVINAATLETLNNAVRCLESRLFGVDVTEVSISRSKIIGDKRHMNALNPVFIVTGERMPG